MAQIYTARIFCQGLSIFRGPIEALLYVRVCACFSRRRVRPSTPSMPINLPNYYFDPVRNRYFPNSSRRPEAAPPTAPKDLPQESHDSIGRLLSAREINGNNAASPQSFSRSVLEAHCAKPRLWSYEETQYKGCPIGDTAIELGFRTSDNILLFVGGSTGNAQIYKVAPYAEPKQYAFRKSIRKRPLLSPVCHMQLDSRVTAIRTLSTRENAWENAIVSTLGSGQFGGDLHLFTFESFELIYEKAVGSSLWTAEYFPCGKKASIGTSRGAGIVDITMDRLSWICRSRSDVLSQKIDSTGNIVFCGFRSGSILAVDIREPLQRFDGQTGRNRAGSSAEFMTYCVPVLKKGVSSHVMQMQSSICSLLVLPSDENYVVGSAMDGTIWLWDRRLVRRGAVSSFPGHVNTHTMLQLGLDPTESLLVSGGEDCTVRLWSLRTGKLVHTEAGFSSAPTAVHWPGSDGLCSREFLSLVGGDFAWTLWLSSADGVYRLDSGMH